MFQVFELLYKFILNVGFYSLKEPSPMPDYLRGSVRDVATFVKVNAIFLYGWKAPDLAARIGISAGDLATDLGHLNATAALAVPNRIIVTGANSPKPSRVVKKDPTAPVTAPASTSTFCAFDKLGAAIAAGWTLQQRSRGVNLTANAVGKRSVSAIAELSNGLRYVFPLNKADFDLHKTALGLLDAASVTTALERNSLVTGSRSKPGKAGKGAGGGSFSTFYSTDSEAAALAAGYSILSKEFCEFDAAGAPAP